MVHNLLGVKDRGHVGEGTVERRNGGHHGALERLAVLVDDDRHEFFGLIRSLDDREVSSLGEEAFESEPAGLVGRVFHEYVQVAGPQACNLQDGRSVLNDLDRSVGDGSVDAEIPLAVGVVVDKELASDGCNLKASRRAEQNEMYEGQDIIPRPPPVFSKPLYHLNSQPDVW